MPGQHRVGSKVGKEAGAAALELRVSGASFADIAVTLGLSTPRQALQLVERTLAARLGPEDIEVQRAEASARLERLLNSVWDKATDADHPEHLPALRMALAVVDRHIKLHGLDRPAEVVLHTPTASELEHWVATVVAAGDQSGVIEADVIGELGP